MTQPNEQYEFICNNCGKVIDGLSHEIYQLAYEGHDCCLSCRPSQPKFNDPLIDRFNNMADLAESYRQGMFALEAQLQQTREELERMRVDSEARYQFDKERTINLETELGQVKAELSAKDKVLEWYGDRKNWNEQDGGLTLIPARLDSGIIARTILSQYSKEVKE